MSDHSAEMNPGRSDRRRKLKRLLIPLLIAGGVIGVALQFVPVKGIGENPPERYAIKAPPEVEAIMKKACFDCHTNETRWPWYARIAPGSWLMARDVKRGRSRMNISEWEDDDKDAQHLDMENSWEQIAAGNMPPWFYQLPFHPDAILSDKEKELLKGWLLAHKAAPAGKQAATTAAEK